MRARSALPREPGPEESGGLRRVWCPGNLSLFLFFKKQGTSPLAWLVIQVRKGRGWGQRPARPWRLPPGHTEVDSGLPGTSTERRGQRPSGHVLGKPRQSQRPAAPLSPARSLSSVLLTADTGGPGWRRCLAEMWVRARLPGDHRVPNHFMATPAPPRGREVQQGRARSTSRPCSLPRPVSLTGGV